MLVQAFLGSLSVVIIYFIARHIFGGQTAVLTSLWAAAYPLFVYYCGFLLGETLVIFLFLFFFLAFVTYIKEHRRAPLIVAAVVYAALVHTDPRFLFHLPFILLYLFIGAGAMKRTVKAFLLFVVVTVLCSLPWAVRNHVAYTDRFVLINTPTLDLWTRSTLTNTYEKRGGDMVETGRAQLNTVEKFEEEKKTASGFTGRMITQVRKAYHA
jgi:4-amino-4-deoxy-L-arabinose transferase-like glycosyltransferase